MSLLFEQIYTDGIAQISYLVGDTDAGIAAVIDPRRDIEVYLERARAHGVHLRTPLKRTSTPTSCPVFTNSPTGTAPGSRGLFRTNTASSNGFCGQASGFSSAP